MPIEYYLLIVGIILMVIELVVPGFGIFGIVGMIFLTGGGYFLMGGGMPALLIILGFYLLVAVVLAILFLYLPRGQNLTVLLGRKGTALTVLRPAGTVLVEKQRLDVISLGDYIPKGASVRIVKVEGSKIFVDLIKE